MATNRIDILDPALLRPGRIDRKVEFPHPGMEVNFRKVINYKFLGQSRYFKNSLQKNEYDQRN